MIKNNILHELVKYKASSDINIKRVSPFINSIYDEESQKINNIFSGKNIPIIAYKSDILYNEINEEINTIVKCFSALNKYTSDTYVDHLLLIDKYGYLYDKLDTSLSEKKNEINKLASYSCINIDTGFSSQTINSYCGKIGKYITLPFFIDGVSLYNDEVTITQGSTGSTIFSNLENINTIPFNRKPSFKITSNNKNISTNITFSLSDTISANAFYIKLDIKLLSLNIYFYNNGTSVGFHSIKDNEAFVTFDPILFDSIQVQVDILNSNTDKPLSIQISDIAIFKNIQFSQYGLFESKTFEIGHIKDISSIAMSYSSYNSNNNIYPLISLAQKDTSNIYNEISINEDIDISPFKYKYSDEILTSSFVSGGKDIKGVNFDTLIISNEDNKFDMSYKEAVVLYGANEDYVNLSNIDNDRRFCNWTKSGNYYITTLLNHSDNVYINIGSLVCNINGKDYTGNIKIPIGISTIKVHSKNINLNFGSTLSKTDTTNTYNFAYIFSGIPEYNSSGTIGEEDFITSSYNIESINTIDMGKSFIPLTESVTDDYSNTYTICLSKTPNTPGTYTIDPYHGRIMINPAPNARIITIKYMPASKDRRPAGILFNRLLTFGKINEILNNNSLFGYDGIINEVTQEKYLFLPKLDLPISKSYILYNKQDDKLYSSIKIKMKTENKYKSLAISDIYLSAK